MLDLSLLANLKETMRTTTDFSEVWRYFLDHFGEDRDFLHMGEETRSPFLETILAEVGGRVFKTEKVVLEHMRLVRIAEHHFVHGGCLINGVMANILYFEDVYQGVLSVARSYNPGEILYARFSGQPMPRPSTEPSAN